MAVPKMLNLSQTVLNSRDIEKRNGVLSWFSGLACSSIVKVPPICQILSCLLWSVWGRIFPKPLFLVPGKGPEKWGETSPCFPPFLKAQNQSVKEAKLKSNSPLGIWNLKPSIRRLLLHCSTTWSKLTEIIRALTKQSRKYMTMHRGHSPMLSKVKRINKSGQQRL